MAVFRVRRQNRYDLLRSERFTGPEARELSKLPKNTPALKLLRAERQVRWGRFTKIAHRKVDQGRWYRREVPGKWQTNLNRMYRRRGWRVQLGPTGKQQPIPKGAANPWAMYRDYERRVGGPGTKGYVSPWELRQVRRGKTLLDKGLLFVQRAKRAGAQAPVAQVQSWIRQLDKGIAGARGARRKQLVLQKTRLERSLA